MSARTHTWLRESRRGRRFFAGCAMLVLAASLHAAGTAPGASSSTVVSATIPSATNLAIDTVGAPPNGCQANAVNVTNFGTVMPNTSAITSADCNVVWGSSNDSAMLRLYQADGRGRAMHLHGSTNALAYYAFDGTPDDGTAAGNDATLGANPNDPTYTTGPFGAQAAQFDGDDYATTPHTAAYAALDTFTIDAWIRLDGLTGVAGEENFLIHKGSGSTDRNFGFGIMNNGGGVGVAVADISASGVNLNSVEGTTNLNDGAWHHVAMVVDSTPADPNKTLKLYVDGVQESITRTFSGNVDNNVLEASYFGSRSGMSRFLLGSAAEVRILASAASATQIAERYGDTAGPNDYDDDNIGSDFNWTEGANMFGACLETATNGATGGAGVSGWTVAGDNSCTTGSTAWNRIATTSGAAGSKVAAVTPGPDIDAAISMRFGFKTAVNQAPGVYEAPVVFQVLAPNV